jgi:hypothetical protein
LLGPGRGSSRTNFSPATGFADWVGVVAFHDVGVIEVGVAVHSAVRPLADGGGATAIIAAVATTTTFITALSA